MSQAYLRVLNRDVSAVCGLKPGQKLFTNCFKDAIKCTLLEEGDDEDEAAAVLAAVDEGPIEDDQLFSSPQTEKTDLDTLAESLNCSPLKDIRSKVKNKDPNSQAPALSIAHCRKGRPECATP